MLEYGILIIITATITGFIMTWAVGANDLANIMSTTMGSRALSVRNALIIAVIFELAGAVLGGGNVTQTIRSGIINATLLNHQPYILVFGMLSVLFASGLWMLFASYVGMPVSITNAIVGSLVGFGAIVLGVHAIHWSKVGAIAISWICSPAIAGIFAYLLFISIKRSIFDSEHPGRSARRRIPIYFFLVGIVLANMTVLKTLDHFKINLLFSDKIAIIIITAFIIAVIGSKLTSRIPYDESYKRFRQHIYVEKLFSILMAFTACAMVFAHGSNDVAIAMGPIAAIISIVKHHGNIIGAPPTWVLWFGGIGVITGLLMYGKKVIVTVGSKITDLTPSRAFAATFAAASTVIVSTSTGIPVSATQTLVGGVLGIGLARGIGALNLTTIRNILLSWFVTIPVAATLATFIFYLLKDTFGS